MTNIIQQLKTKAKLIVEAVFHILNYGNSIHKLFCHAVRSIFFNLLVEMILIHVNMCHTLISSEHHCLSTCDLCLTTLKCLTPIAKESIKFQDVSGRNRPKTRKQDCIQQSGVCVNKLSYPNIVRGPYLHFTTSKFLIPIAMESVKFQDVSKRKQPKNTKAGGELIKHGGCTQETSSTIHWKVG